jgi:hypothetical protein
MLRVAQSCCEGVKALAKIPDSNTLIAYAIVASHGVESTLKCHLLQKGKTLHDCLRLGHDLLRAWDTAVSEGDPIKGPTPGWLRILNRGHDKPYAFRYLPDMYGIGAPDSTIYSVGGNQS